MPAEKALDAPPERAVSSPSGASGSRPTLRDALILALAVGFTHYGGDDILAAATPYLPEPVAARWWEFVLRGFEGAILCAALLPLRPAAKLAGAVWVLACGAGIIEESQRAACGLVSFGSSKFVPAFSGLCLEEVGRWPYAVLLLVSMAALGLIWWRRRWLDKYWWR